MTLQLPESIRFGRIELSLLLSDCILLQLRVWSGRGEFWLAILAGVWSGRGDFVGMRYFVIPFPTPVQFRHVLGLSRVWKGGDESWFQTIVAFQSKPGSYFSGTKFQWHTPQRVRECLSGRNDIPWTRFYHNDSSIASGRWSRRRAGFCASQEWGKPPRCRQIGHRPGTCRKSLSCTSAELISESFSTPTIEKHLGVVGPTPAKSRKIFRDPLPTKVRSRRVPGLPWVERAGRELVSNDRRFWSLWFWTKFKWDTP